jgi:hypothetical protein
VSAIATAAQHRHPFWHSHHIHHTSADHTAAAAFLLLPLLLSPPAACTDAKFQDTGLERSAALAADLAYMQQQHKLPPPEIKEDGPGMTYAKHLKQLAASDPQSFICHYYNYYFAHTAGGRMIGKKVRQLFHSWVGVRVRLVSRKGFWKPCTCCHHACV